MKKRFFACFLVCGMIASLSSPASAHGHHAEYDHGCNFVLSASAATVPEAQSETSAAPEAQSDAPAAAPETESKTAASAGAPLSDDLYSFQMKLDGKIYQFPMSYADFIACGWEYQGDETLTFAPDQYSPSEVFKKGDLEIYVSIINLGIDTEPVTECLVGGLSIDEWQFEAAPRTSIELPKGIVYGKSTLEDIKAAYGEPSDTYEGELYTKVTYEYDYYREIDLYVSTETDVINEVEIRNFIADEEAKAEAAAQVSSEPTSEVLAYTAPSELGDDPLSFVVEYAGDLYQMPAPVSVFLDNGWTLKAEDSDSVIAGKDFGWVYMMKDGQQFRSIVRNYGADATTVENCFVTSVDGNINDTDLPITIPSGVTIGMTNEDVLDALKEIKYTLDDESSDMFLYYTIESPENSLDGIEILVDKEDNTVTGIEVSCEPDELPY